MKKEITFDRFIRGAGAVCLAALIIFLINRLSNVLIPFVVAWLVAYLIYPIVIFFEKTCHFRNRVLSIFVTGTFHRHCCSIGSYYSTCHFRI